MTHNENSSGLHNELRQRRCHDAGLDLGAALRRLVPAAEEGKIIAILDDRLIAAARKRHFNRKRCKIIVLAEVHAVLADADGNGCGDTGRICNLADGFEQRELCLRHGRKLFCLQQQQKPVALQAAQQTVIFVRPAADLLIDLRVEIGNCRIRQIVRQLIVVIHKHNRYHRTRADILIAHLQKLRHILQIDHAHQQVVFGIFIRKQRAGHAKTSAAITELVRTFGLAGSQPFQSKGGKNLVYALGKNALSEIDQIGKRFIIPYQLVFVQLDQRDRKRHFPVCGSAHHFVRLLNIFAQQAAAARSHPLIEKQQQKRYGRLSDGKIILPQHQCRNSKQYHNHKIKQHIRLHQPMQFFVHLRRPPFGVRIDYLIISNIFVFCYSYFRFLPRFLSFIFPFFKFLYTSLDNCGIL